MAIGTNGLPIPDSYTLAGLDPRYPPVLCFLARPEVSPPADPPAEKEDIEIHDDLLDVSKLSGDSIVEIKQAETSFLVRNNDLEEKLALEDRVKQVLDFKLSHDHDDLHNLQWYDLYADIAGISRDKCDSSNQRHEYRPPTLQ